ncbi:MAG TPA: DUF3147 family protein [Terriglobales bacterium]|nr:DUF3147 family protein [Terriglobales bacterium]
MSGLKRAKWYEYLIRFTLGGLVTAIAGFIADKFGPAIGGLFLAFPAILVASSTLIEKHERERKEQHGLHGLYRGRHAAGADAAGAAVGSLGLMAFGWFVWKFAPGHSAPLVIALATLIWAVVSGGVWWVWKRNYPHRLWKAFATKT